MRRMPAALSTSEASEKQRKSLPVFKFSWTTAFLRLVPLAGGIALSVAGTTSNDNGLASPGGVLIGLGVLVIIGGIVAVFVAD